MCQLSNIVIYIYIDINVSTFFLCISNYIFYSIYHSLVLCLLGFYRIYIVFQSSSIHTSFRLYQYDRWLNLFTFSWGLFLHKLVLLSPINLAPRPAVEEGAHSMFHCYGASPGPCSAKTVGWSENEFEKLFETSLDCSGWSFHTIHGSKVCNPKKNWNHLMVPNLGEASQSPSPAHSTLRLRTCADDDLPTTLSTCTE